MTIFHNAALNRLQKPLHDQIVDAINEGNTVAVQNLVNQVHEIPDYIFTIAVGCNMVDTGSILVAKCTNDTIDRGLSRFITRCVQNVPIDTQMIQIILPYADQITRNRAMANACVRGHSNVVELLYPLCNFEEVLVLLQKSSGPHAKFWTANLQEHLNAEKLRATLDQEIKVPDQVSKRKIL